jgi:hypothetical protein
MPATIRCYAGSRISHLGMNMISQTISAPAPATADSPALGGSRIKPLAFWLYVLVGVMMIIGSAIALPFLPARSR